MTPEFLPLLSGASAVLAGVLSAQSVGHITCGWPARQDELLMRINSLKQSQVCRLRLVQGMAAVWLTLGGGTLTAYAAASPQAASTPVQPETARPGRVMAVGAPAPDPQAKPSQAEPRREPGPSSVTQAASPPAIVAPSPATRQYAAVIRLGPAAQARAYAQWAAQALVRAQRQLDSAEAALAAASPEARAQAQIERTVALVALSRAQNSNAAYMALAEHPDGAAQLGLLGPDGAILPPDAPRPPSTLPVANLQPPAGIAAVQDAAAKAEDNALARTDSGLP